MKPTLYVHTGSPKTGTSTIQNLLNKNRDRLRVMGICYPKPLVGPFLMGHEGHLSMSKMSSLLMYDKNSYEYYLNCYIKELTEANLPHNILSAESFSSDQPEIFELFYHSFDIKIIHYFRDVFSFLSSLIKQIAKEGLREDLFLCHASYVRNSIILQRLPEYIKYFGIDNCIFKDFNFIKSHGLLLDDFLKTVGCCNMHELDVSPNINVSPSDVTSMFFYQLSFLPLSRAGFSAIRQDVLSMDLSCYGEYRCTLLPPQAFELDEECTKAIRRQGELLGDPDWYDRTMVQREKLAAIPNDDLPPEIQYHILSQLSEKSRNILLQHCPEANGKAMKSFLPAMNSIPRHDFNLLTSLRRSYCVNHNNGLRQAQKLREYEARDQIRATQLRRSATGLRAVWSQIKACYQSLLSSHARQAYAIRESGLFDTPWYLERNPDVAKADIDPILHYVRCGAAEGRDPSPWFSTLSYLNRNPDVVKEGVNPFYHYICHGTTEGRQLS